MWYVNVPGTEGLSGTLSSFILTMWYVNLDIKDVHLVRDYKFYINYVVCKLKGTLKRQM